jgi:hypothetical protein
MLFFALYPLPSPSRSIQATPLLSIQALFASEWCGIEYLQWHFSGSAKVNPVAKKILVLRRTDCFISVLFI